MYRSMIKYNLLNILNTELGLISNYHQDNYLFNQKLRNYRMNRYKDDQTKKIEELNERQKQVEDKIREHNELLRTERKKKEIIKRKKQMEHIKYREELKRNNKIERKQVEIEEKEKIIEEKEKIIEEKKSIEEKNRMHYYLAKIKKEFRLNFHPSYMDKIFNQYTFLFRKFVQNKTVAIVGPANSIIGSGKGKTIDKFDIVIRLNKALPLPFNLSEDIGTKTTIIYNSLNVSDYPGQNILDTNLYKKYGVKYVCCSYPYASVFVGDINNYVQKYQFDIPFRCVERNKYYKFKNQIKTRPYTGTSAIMDILSFDVKALYITGIDFYNTPYYSQYRDVSKRRLSGLRSNGIHNAYSQMEYLLYKSLTDKRVILDEKLEKLLYNNYFSFYNKLIKINRESTLFKQTSTIVSQKFIKYLFSFNHKFAVILPNIVYTNFEKYKLNDYDIVFVFKDYNIVNQVDDEKIILVGNKKFNSNRINIRTDHYNRGNIIHYSKLFIKHVNRLLKILDIKQLNMKTLFLMSLLLFSQKIDIIGYRENYATNRASYKEIMLINFFRKKDRFNMI
jgi:hypothetical protein